VGRSGLDEDLGRGTPDDHDPVAIVGGLEVTNVPLKSLDVLTLAGAGLDVRALQPAHVVLVEHGGHRLNRLELVGDRLDVRVAVEHAALDGRLVGVVSYRIPGAEDQLVDAGQGHEVPDQRRAGVGPLAEANGAHLSQRADGLSQTALRQLDAGDEGRSHRAEANGEDAHPAGGGRDFLFGNVHEVFCLQIDAVLARQLE
jgi:hypothetical protein